MLAAGAADKPGKNCGLAGALKGSGVATAGSSNGWTQFQGNPKITTGSNGQITVSLNDTGPVGTYTAADAISFGPLDAVGLRATRPPRSCRGKLVSPSCRGTLSP